MSKFLIGLLLGLLIGIAGASGFLIKFGGGDYLVSTSPRVRELEATLREAQRERDGLEKRVGQLSEVLSKLESRFSTLAARLEGVAGNGAAAPGGAAPPTQPARDPGTKVEAEAPRP